MPKAKEVIRLRAADIKSHILQLANNCLSLTNWYINSYIGSKCNKKYKKMGKKG